MKFILGIFLFTLIFCLPVESKEFRYLIRDPNALLMGDAFTASAHGNYTLFYNPAALGKNDELTINPLNGSFGFTNVLDDLDRFDNFPKEAAEIAARVMELPLYVNAGTVPGIKLGGFGFNLYANSSTSIVLRNQTHPFLDIDYRYDRGFIMGYAHSFGLGGKRVKGKITAGHRFSVGASVKHITREGMDESFSFFGPELLNAVADASDYSTIRRRLGYSKGSGWGGDVGFEYAMSSGSTTLLTGFSILDIADTRFKRDEGFKKIPRQKMAMNWGAAFVQDFMLFDYSLNFDIHPLNEPTMATKSKIHLGAEVGLPLLRFYAGWNGGYFSYGGKIRLWPISISAGFYGVELGNSYRKNKGSRAIVYVELFDIDVDMF
ncbi:MAG: hypothetical protein KC493_05715 [Bacteriovoracaceae bacterium]|nr:hypothetical protein [Bacteriovoracaceae bacterium]